MFSLALSGYNVWLVAELPVLVLKLITTVEAKASWTNVKWILQAEIDWLIYKRHHCWERMRTVDDEMDCLTAKLTQNNKNTNKQTNKMDLPMEGEGRKTGFDTGDDETQVTTN